MACGSSELSGVFCLFVLFCFVFAVMLSAFPSGLVYASGTLPGIEWGNLASGSEKTVQLRGKYIQLPGLNIVAILISIPFVCEFTFGNFKGKSKSRNILIFFKVTYKNIVK